MPQGKLHQPRPRPEHCPHPAKYVTQHYDEDGNATYLVCHLCGCRVVEMQHGKS